MPVASTLSRVVSLGGNVGSSQLREWDSLEFQGYVVATTRSHGVVRLGLPGSAELVKMMNYRGAQRGLDF